jgi:hypothetical protein
MIELNIQITEQNILEGCPNDANTCPIALAIERAVVNYFKLDLNKDYVSVEVADIKPKFSILRPGETSEEYIANVGYIQVCNFVGAFDNFFKVDPFELTMKFDLIEGDTEF